MLFTYCFVVNELANNHRSDGGIFYRSVKGHEVASSNAIQEAETSLVTTRLLTVYQLYILYWLGEG